MNILETKNLTLSFGKLIVTNNLSFEVEEGEIFGIAGPNGAGKSTLFNLLTGFYRGSGEIIFKNKKISGMAPFQITREGIGRTFQIPQLFTTLTVEENVSIGAYFGDRNLQDEKQNVKEAISFVGLAGKEKICVENLNLYDKKMTMIAAALATKPELLLLDEPVGGLSPKEVWQSMDLFKRMNQDLGLTIILIEHVMRVITELSNRLMILSSGQRICLGSPQEVCQNEQIIKLYLGVGV